MFVEDDPYVQFKLDILKRALPAQSAVVFGDIYVVDGGYSKKCVEYGCTDVLLIDAVDTVAWQKTRIEHPALDFYKGDFSNPNFMRSINRQYDIGVVYDILLHQAPLISTIHLMLEKVGKRFCIVQPMLPEQAMPNSLVYLPGYPDKGIYPFPSLPADAAGLFDVHEVNQSRWLWGLTVSFLRSVMKGEGFEIVHEAEFPHHSLTKPWMLWGCVAERREANPLHWSAVQLTPGLQNFNWGVDDT